MIMIKKFTIVASLISLIMLVLLTTLPAHRVYSATTSATSSTDITISPVQGPGVGKKLQTRAISVWPWYITRASGIVAVALLLLLIISGIGLVTGYTFKFFEPLNAWAVHKALGMSLIVAAAIHGFVLLFDTYVKFSITQILFPFASNYRPVTINGIHLGTLWVSLGIFAFYGLAAIIISSLFWIDKKPKIWKLIHILSYLVAIMIFFHGLYLGTDLTHGLFRTIWIVFGIIVFGAVIVRIRRARSV